jgi:hypothetical protein
MDSCLSRRRVVRPEEALEDRDRAPDARVRRVEFAELLLHDAEVAERERDLATVSPRRLMGASRDL